MTADKPFSSATTPGSLSELQKLNERSRTIFRQIVESYLATGDPVGSRNLARAPADDAVAGLDPQRHVGPGASGAHLRARTPRRAGCRPRSACGCSSTACSRSATSPTTSAARSRPSSRIRREKSVEQVLNDAGEMISGLSHCAGVVLADKQVSRLKHIEFVPLEPGKALVVLVGDDQSVENRVIDLPAGLPPSSLIGGRQLSQRPHPRPDPGRGQGHDREGAGLRQGRARPADAEGHRGGACHLVGRARRPEEPDRARPGQPAQGHRRPGEPGAHPPAVRRPRDQARSGPAAGPLRARRGRAHLHRLGEQAVLALRLLADRCPLRGPAAARSSAFSASSARRASTMPASFRWWTTRPSWSAAC